MATRLAWLSLCILAGCASTPAPLESDPRDLAMVQSFARTRAGEAMPPAWRPYILSRLKLSTEYQVVDHEGRRAARAVAEGSASGFSQDLAIDLKTLPYLSWSWNVGNILETANNARGPDDAPARVIVAFDGDKSSLDFEDRAFAERIKALTGHDVPYATLMYIWSNTEPVGTIISNRFTTRIKMIVAKTGRAGLGTWIDERHNLAADYQRAFKEAPGRVVSVGIMTDTDNTGERVVTYYGDISLQPAVN